MVKVSAGGGMIKVSIAQGVVNAISSSAVSVILKGGRVVVAKNFLGHRCPPGSTVAVAQAEDGSWGIVGRER